MNKFSVNLSTIFTEVPFLERFQNAREHGFDFVECQFPYAYSIEQIKEQLELYQLSLVLLNLPPGNWDAGERGLATDPNRMEEFRMSVAEGIKYATALHVPNIHCMAGIVLEEHRKRAREVYIENLQYAGTEMAKQGITLLIEPINNNDMPGYFMNNINEAKEIVAAVDLPNVKLQFDFYHIHRIHGNELEIFQQNSDLVGHIQIADVPGRHEPGTGEMDYERILNYLNNTYKGYIGLEYTPSGRSEESFNWREKIGKGGL